MRPFPGKCNRHHREDSIKCIRSVHRRCSRPRRSFRLDVAGQPISLISSASICRGPSDARPTRRHRSAAWPLHDRLLCLMSPVPDLSNGTRHIHASPCQTTYAFQPMRCPPKHPCHGCREISASERSRRRHTTDRWAMARRMIRPNTAARWSRRTMSRSR